MRRTTLVGLAAALLLTCGCTKPQPAAPVRIAAAPARRPASLDATSFADALRRAGVEVTGPEPTSTLLFGRASRTLVLTVGDRHILVDTFSTSAEASRVASKIDQDGSGGPFEGNVFAEVEWKDPPHFFRRDRLIVTYFQAGFPARTPADARVLRAIEGVTGAQFAGYRR